MKFLGQSEISTSDSESFHEQFYWLLTNALIIAGWGLALTFFRTKFSVEESEKKLSKTETDKKRTEIRPHKDKKVVLVTGVAGFIGSNCAIELIERGDVVIGIDELNDYYDVGKKQYNLQRVRNAGGKNNFTFYKGDICNEELLSEIFSEHKPEWVLHLAARAGVRPSIDDPFVYIHSNVEGTTRLLSAAAKSKVKHFVFASSSSVYGGSKNHLFSEDDDVSNPVSPYAATKKSCELLGSTYNHLYSMPIAALRFFTVYGPNGRPDMAAYKFVDRVSRGEQLFQFGDGSTSRDYTFISDIVDGCIRTLDRPSGFQIYNLGNGSPVKLKDFISLVEDTVGRKANIKILPEQPGDVPRTCADISKAKEMLGYNPSTTFAEGIKKTVQWYDAYHSDSSDSDSEIKPTLLSGFAA